MSTREESRRLVAVWLWQVKDSGQAIQFATHEEGHPECRKVWMPVSLIRSISRFPEPGQTWPKCKVKMPLWKADELEVECE